LAQTRKVAQAAKSHRSNKNFLKCSRALYLASEASFGMTGGGVLWVLLLGVILEAPFAVVAQDGAMVEREVSTVCLGGYEGGCAVVEHPAASITPHGLG
jgi:hypothetical protein